jgi:dihydroorotase
LPAIPEAAETVGVARDLALIETTGIRAHFACLSSAKAVSMVANAQQRGLRVSAGVTAHHLHLSEADVGMFNTQCKVMPPLARRTGSRGAAVRTVAEGVLAVICSDHQAHGKDAKLAPFSEAASGIAGIESLLGLAMNLVREGILDIDVAPAALTCNPAQILGNRKPGRGPGRSPTFAFSIRTTPGPCAIRSMQQPWRQHTRFWIPQWSREGLWHAWLPANLVYRA